MPDDNSYYDDLSGRLYAAVLADILDDLGAREQVLSPAIRPVYAGAAVVGRAATMRAAAVSEVPADPYKLQLQTLDGVQPGEVVVCAVAADQTAAIWGELMSVHSRARGGRGVITDGLVRDVWGIEEIAFPVFAAGYSPADSKGRLDVVEARTEIEVGGVRVNDGDLVVADIDGAVAIPRELEEEAVARALEKVAGEDTIRGLLESGASLEDVFREHGIL